MSTQAVSFFLRELIQFSQIFKAEYAGIMPVRKAETQSVSSDDGDVIKSQEWRDRTLIEHLFTGPLVDAAGAWAFPPELRGRILGFGIVRPLDRYLAGRFFNYLGGFDHLLVTKEFLDLSGVNAVMRRVIDRFSVLYHKCLRRLMTMC